MDMQHHEGPLTEIVEHVKKDVKKIEHPSEMIKHKAGYLEELISKKIDEETLPFEKEILNKILEDPNTEKLIEYIANHPKTKKIVVDIAEEKLQQLKEEFTKQLKILENQHAQNFKELIYVGVGITVMAVILIASYS
ncbi:MAG TPA: hypothetical protein VHX42_00155 [Candidatus Babeliales bacterium]|nr:hypothetical protein [Candidatus Babeliales bacterium]